MRRGVVFVADEHVVAENVDEDVPRQCREKRGAGWNAHGAVSHAPLCFRATRERPAKPNFAYVLS